MLVHCICICCRSLKQREINLNLFTSFLVIQNSVRLTDEQKRNYNKQDHLGSKTNFLATNDRI